MAKLRLTFYCITLMLFCQPVMGVGAVSEGQKKAVQEHCEAVKEVLKNVQRDDSRARVYLGGYYETILNVRLVENNLSTASLVENQNNLAEAKTLFASDFIGYQQELEDLIAMDCKKTPEDFYDKLTKVRQKRKIVEQDTLKVRSLLSGHVKLVTQLEGKL